jgi:thiol-disulfide isomerase/thioredoxin
VLVRLLIAFELLTGLFLMLKQFYEQVWWLMLLSLTGFTCFLVYAALFRNDANCHCFGDFVELNPAHSIVKNAVTIILLLFIRKESDYQFRFRKLAVGICFAVAVILPFVVFPMDALYNKFASPNDPINVVAFEELRHDTALRDFNVEQVNYLVAFYISKCKFCRLSMKKVNTIVENNHLDIDKIKILISGSDEGIEEFKKNIAIFDYQFFQISPYHAINLTDGHFPTFLYVQNGKVLKSINLRGISEEELVDFLK